MSLSFNSAWNLWEGGGGLNFFHLEGKICCGPKFVSLF